MKPNTSPHRGHDRQYFYKYVSAPTAKTILRTGRLRWSSPILFNDPFDVTQELRLNFSPGDLSKAVADELADLIIAEGQVGVGAHPALRLILSALDTTRDKHLREEIARALRNYDQPTPGQVNALEELRSRWSAIVPMLRVLCFSEAYDVTSMWLHYADKYRGAVLQFEANDELDSAWLMARPVKYQDDPPAIASARAWARCILRNDGPTYMELITELQYVKARTGPTNESGGWCRWPARGRSATSPTGGSTRVNS